MLTDFLKNSKNETECNDLHGTGQYTAWDRTARGGWRPARLRGVHACAGSRYTADARGKLRIREGAFVCLDWAGKVRH